MFARVMGKGAAAAAAAVSGIGVDVSFERRVEWIAHVYVERQT